MTLRPVIALFLGLFSLTAFAAEVSAFRVWTDPEKTRAVLDLSSRAEYQVFTLQGPDRIVIDLSNSSLHDSLDLTDQHAGVISGVRYGIPVKNTLRVVLDLTTNSKVKSFMLDPTGEYGHRLVIDLYSEEAQASASASVKQIDDRNEENRKLIVAIDAGHGGEDPGARGPKRTREKDVVLAISRELKKAIDAKPGLTAVLTRDGDYFLPLRDRYEKARRNHADLFVSVHADAFRNPKVSGGSVFVLSSRGASSEFARRLATSENNSDLVGGVTLNDKDDMLASVLLDLSQSATMEASNLVAQNVFASMAEFGETHKNTVESANLMVLKSPDVPSILVETAFISNPNEEARLRDSAWQKKMASTIANGLQDYFYLSPPPGSWIAANRQPLRHRVVSGDTLGDIAYRYQVSVNSLRRANDLTGDSIRVGSELLIPTT